MFWNNISSSNVIQRNSMHFNRTHNPTPSVYRSHDTGLALVKIKSTGHGNVAVFPVSTSVVGKRTYLLGISLFMAMI